MHAEGLGTQAGNTPGTKGWFSKPWSSYQAVPSLPDLVLPLSLLGSPSAHPLEGSFIPSWGASNKRSWIHDVLSRKLQP